MKGENKKRDTVLYNENTDDCRADTSCTAARTVVSFKDLLLGKTVYKKSGEKLKIVQVNSVSDIVGQVLFEHDMPLSKIMYHITILDIDPSSFRHIVQKKEETA